jgi:hypothetical protein
MKLLYYTICILKDWLPLPTKFIWLKEHFSTIAVCNLQCLTPDDWDKASYQWWVLHATWHKKTLQYLWLFETDTVTRPSSTLCWCLYELLRLTVEHHWVKDNFRDVSLQKLLLNTITKKILTLTCELQKEYLAWMLCPTSLTDQTPKSLPSQTEKTRFSCNLSFPHFFRADIWCSS